MKIKYLFRILVSTAIAAVAAPPDSSAQFYTNGSDPGSAKWQSVETAHYKVIFPKSIDSLAFEYGVQLEKWREAVSVSSGLLPGQGYRRKTRVILHPWHGISNASVTWAPKRLDIYTMPDAYDPEPLPWSELLAIHEGRHIAQMQFGYRKWLKPWAYILGDMAPGAWSALWPNTWFLEGDAVVAETALTRAGRGRSADFMEYYKAAFANRDTRNWYRWRYGSYRHYTPDHYALGYMTIAGIRYCFDDPLFSERYLDYPARRPFRCNNRNKTVKEASGMKFNDSFQKITETFSEIWKESEEERKPFCLSERISPESNWYTGLYGTVVYDGRMFAIRSGLREAAHLVEINPKDGSEKRLTAFPATSSRLSTSCGKLWWSESIPDPRWSLKMTSKIMSYDISSGKISSLTKEGRLFNPAPSDDGKILAAVSLPVEGGSDIVIVSSENGEILKSYTLPSRLQAAEVRFLDNYLYFTAISKEGTGIYRISDNFKGEIETICAPLPISIRNLNVYDGELHFAADRTSANEYYRLDCESGKIMQLTSLRFGGAEFCFHDGDLYFTATNGTDKMLHRTSDVLDKEVTFSNIHKYKVADKLSEQEHSIASAKGIDLPSTRTSQNNDFNTDFSPVKRYRKLPNMFRFHSWAPVYFNYNKVKNMSGDISYLIVSPGVTALFQNSLGTAWGSVGYSTHMDPYKPKKRRHSGHAIFSYSGLYPAIEASLDINDRDALQYLRKTTLDGAGQQESYYAVLTDIPLIQGSIKAYIPLDFSSGGWQRGIVPQITYSISNDRFCKSEVRVSTDENFEGGSLQHFVGLRDDANLPMQRLTASVRGYALRHKAPSEVWPDYGVGLEIGYSVRTGIANLFSPAGYIYGYGYLPGITKNQGLKLTGIYQYQQECILSSENIVSVASRGFSKTPAEQFISQNSKNHLRLGADYAIPFWIGDISWFSKLFYIKNFDLTPHVDCSIFKMNDSSVGSLLSAGASLTANMANLIWVPYDWSIGISAGWNGGKSLGLINANNPNSSRNNYYINLVFNMSL